MLSKIAELGIKGKQRLTAAACVTRLTMVFSICSRALRAVRCRSAESAPIAMLNTDRTACQSRHFFTIHCMKCTLACGLHRRLVLSNNLTLVSRFKQEKHANNNICNAPKQQNELSVIMQNQTSFSLR